MPSAVGVHCVDCARRNASSRRGVSSLLGGRAITDALVTKGLIIACVTIYLVQMALPSLGAQFAFVPAVASSQPWRFMTTAFLHASLMHLAFNMWALWVLGSALEPILGRWRFAALCALSALGGSTMIYWLASPTAPASWLTSTVGASGAVFGLFAALFIIQRRFGRDTSAIVGLLVLNLAISFIGANISWQGHLGGLVTGGDRGGAVRMGPEEQAHRLRSVRHCGYHHRAHRCDLSAGGTCMSGMTSLSDRHRTVIHRFVQGCESWGSTTV